MLIRRSVKPPRAQSRGERPLLKARLQHDRHHFLPDDQTTTLGPQPRLPGPDLTLFTPGVPLMS